MSSKAKKTAWFLMPFVWLWDLLSIFLNLTGRIVGLVIGFALMIVGIILTVTVIAAPVGIPLIIISMLIMLRSVF